MTLRMLSEFMLVYGHTAGLLLRRDTDAASTARLGDATPAAPSTARSARGTPAPPPAAAGQPRAGGVLWTVLHTQLMADAGAAPLGWQVRLAAQMLWSASVWHCAAAGPTRPCVFV